MSESEGFVVEMLSDVVETLHRIETLLDTLVTVSEDIEDAAAETAYLSRSKLHRWAFKATHRKEMRQIRDNIAEEFVDKLKFPG